MIVVSLGVCFITALIEVLTKSRGVVFISYGVVIPLVLLLPRFFYKFDKKVRQTVSKEWIKRLDFFSFFTVLFNAPASLILHELNFQYDRFLHFSVAGFGLIIFFLLWLPVAKIKGKKIGKTFLIQIFFISLFGIFLWEGLQYSIDQIAGTKLFFDYSQTIMIDFSEDIIFGTIGLLLALLYINYFFRKFLKLIY